MCPSLDQPLGSYLASQLNWDSAIPARAKYVQSTYSMVTLIIGHVDDIVARECTDHRIVDDIFIVHKKRQIKNTIAT